MAKDDFAQQDEELHGTTKQARVAAYMTPIWDAYRSTVDSGTNDEETALADLLADLMHFAAERGLSFDSSLDSAERHYGAEHDDPDQELHTLIDAPPVVTEHKQRPFRIMQAPHRSTLVYFQTEQEMRAAAQQLARFNESDVTLEAAKDGIQRHGDEYWDVIETVAWDGQPAGQIPTKLMTFKFAATVTARVREWDCYGSPRDLPEAMRDVLEDALGHELQYEQPEPTDLVQGVESYDLSAFEVTSIVDVEDSSNQTGDSDDEDDDEG